MAEAPRLRAFFERIQGRSVLVMRRSDWNVVSGIGEHPVVLDVARTPLAHVARDASVIAAVAYQAPEGMGEVAIFRNDPKDAPTPINQDKYSVFLDLGAHPDLPSFITRASTEDNSNLRQYIQENVFLVKQNPGSEHWLSELPASISSVIRST